MTDSRSKAQRSLADELIRREVCEHDRNEILAFAEYLRTGGMEVITKPDDDHSGGWTATIPTAVRGKQ